VRRLLPCVPLLFSLGLSAAPASGKSDLLLPVPHSFGTFPASTYNEDGKRVGAAHLVIERLDNGHVRLFGESGIDGSARNVVTAEFESANGGGALRLLRQTSRSWDSSGHGLGQLAIDHEGGMGTCDAPQASGDRQKTMELPDLDRIANIPVNLLFLPLATGERDEVEFEVFLCSGKPRLVKAKATVARRVKTEDGLRNIVEVRYDLDLGPLLSRLARPFIPKVAVWFDPKDPEAWLAHRMPLFAKGPTVMVVRTGISPELLN
jgi:hypothetical protein